MPQSNAQQLLEILGKSTTSMVSKDELINVAMYFKNQNDVIKNIITELTIELFKENPNHPRFAEFSEEDRNRLRVVKFGGTITTEKPKKYTCSLGIKDCRYQSEENGQMMCLQNEKYTCQFKKQHG